MDGSINDKLLEDMQKKIYALKELKETRGDIFSILALLVAQQEKDNKLKRDIDNLHKLLNSNEQEDFKKVVKFNLSKVTLDSKEKALELCNEYYKEMYEKRYKNLESKRAYIGRNKE